MPRLGWLILCLTLRCFDVGFAQNDWISKSQSVLVVKNDRECIPIASLLQPIHWQTLPDTGLVSFTSTLSRYTSPAEPAHIEIWGVDAKSADLKRSIETIALHSASLQVVALFGDAPPSLVDSLSKISTAFIQCAARDDTVQSIAAQIIFGAMAAAANGGGLPTKALGRLCYAPPAVVGMDGNMLADSIRAIVEEGIRKKAFPGAQVLIARKGCVVYHQAFGFFTYDSLRPLRTDDIYDLASITKVSSTLPALMKLYGEGRLDLDAPLYQYFPFLKKSDKANLTLRLLLAHHGGLKPGIVFWQKARRKNGKWKWRTFKSRPSKRFPVHITDSLYAHRRFKRYMYRSIAKLPLNDQRGYVYSDLPFILTPYLVEKLTGEELASYLGKTFYKPLGTHFTYNPLQHFPKERIVPTEVDTFFRRELVQGTVHDENASILGGVSGHAGLFATANDLAILFQMYLNGGEYGGQRFIAKDAVEEFTRCQYCQEGNRRALGFDRPPAEYVWGQAYVARSAGPRSYGHSGFTGTFVWADPDSDLIVVFLSNRVHPYRSHRALYELNIRPRIHQVAYDAIIER